VGIVATLAVGVDPGLCELLGGRVIEQAVERRADLPEGGGLGLGHDPVVPLDAGEKGRLAEVRAADEGDARAVFPLEDVGLRVEAEGGRWARVLGAGGVRGFEDADLAVAFEIEEADEGFGLGDAEVVAREEAEPAVSGQEVAEVGLEAMEAARHDEADGDVGGRRLGQLFAQVAVEGIVFAAGDETV